MACGFICLEKRKIKDYCVRDDFFRNNGKVKNSLFSMDMLRYFSLCTLRPGVLTACHCRNFLTRLQDGHILPFFQVAAMELVCEKYKEKVDSEKAVCRRPTEYCKFRGACLLHFLARERAGEEKKEPENKAGRGEQAGPAVVGEL